MIDLSKLNPVMRKKIALEFSSEIFSESSMICYKLQTGEITLNDEISKELDNLKEVYDQTLQYI